MTIGTEPLTLEATWREIEALVNFLSSLGVEQVEVTYGWGCKADGIEQPVRVPLAELVIFLHKNIAQEIYHLGEDNLYIVSDNPTLKLTLCHDADIHFEANDKAIVARLRDEWEARGLRVWRSKEATQNG
jgi:hypothetical protein